MVENTNFGVRLASAIVSFCFALCGAHDIIRLIQVASWTYARDYQELSEDLFMIISGTVSGVLVIGVRWSTYLGFLLSWTGRAIYYLCMGCYFFPIYYVYSCGKSCDNVEMSFELACAGNGLLSIILGIVLLVMRSQVTYIHRVIGYQGQSLPIDAVAALAAVASLGTLGLGMIYLLSIGNRNQTFPELWQVASRAFFLLVSGFSSLVSTFSLNSCISAYFGFLYSRGGRGIFYLMLGLYTLPLSLTVRLDNWLWQNLCWISSFTSIIMGIVYLSLSSHYRAGGHVVYREQSAPQGYNVYQSRGPVHMQAYPHAPTVQVTTTRTQPAHW
mmetsp:Transcript_48539/g.113649  ORF Transcript_48539/g.113649 Transcript_48539/m.113649 type:complete len:329 (+) Transcript_48539:45-1031(+)